MGPPRKGWAAALWPLLVIGGLMAYQYRDFLFLLVVVGALAVGLSVVKSFVGGNGSSNQRGRK